MKAERDLVTPVRWVVGVFTAGTVALSSVGFWFALRDPRTLGTDEVSDLFHSMGVPVEFAIAFGLVLPMFIATLVAGLILVRRPDSVFVLVFALSVVTMSATVSRAPFAFSAGLPSLRPAAALVYVIGLSTFGYFLLIFPGEHFQSRGMAAFWLASVALALSRPTFFEAITTRRIDAESTGVDMLYLVAYAVLFMVIFGVQFFRYRTAGDRPASR